MGRIICMRPVNGVDSLVTVTTAAGNQGSYVTTIVGVGKPFWWFNTIPTGKKVVAADFTNAPIATANAMTNNNLIAAITVTLDDETIFTLVDI